PNGQAPHFQDLIILLWVPISAPVSWLLPDYCQTIGLAAAGWLWCFGSADVGPHRCRFNATLSF
ncbi:MAG: hypothetical protein QMC14_06765, partial [Paracoccaceae bacterium]